MASKQELEQCWELLQLLQPGDIVGVEGQLCATRTGEISIRASSVGLDKLSQAKTMTYSDVFKEFCNIRLVDAFADPFAEWRKPTGTN